jgi:hypothetical protein
MKTMLSVFLFSFSLASFACSAHAAECLNATDVAQISADFKFTAKNKNLKFDACDSKNRINQIYAGLIALKTYPMQAFVKDRFDANIISVPPYQFFKNRVHTIIMEEPSKEDCDKDSQAFVNPDSRNNNEIHICPSLTEMDWFTAAAVLIHESRHLDKAHNHYEHVPCEGESLNEAWSCDDSYSVGGSYGTETEYFIKAARTTGLHPALRAEAYSTAISNFFAHFKKKPFGTETGSLVKTTSGQLFFHHGNEMIPLSISVDPKDLLILKDGSASVFQVGEKILSGLDLQGHNNSPQEIDNAKVQGILELDTDEVLDIFIDEKATCVLTARFSRCDLGKGKMAEHSITGFTPLQYVMPDRSSIATVGLTSVSATDGYLYQVDKKTGWIKSAKKMDIKNTQGIGSKLDLVLFADGRTGVYDAKKKSWSFPTEFKGMSVDKIMTPFVWAKDMNQF